NYGDDHGGNDSIQTATPVAQRIIYADARYDYNFRAVVSCSSDIDYYSITSPLLSTVNNASQQMVMVVTVWALNGSLADTRLKVYDQNQNLVAARVLTNNDGSFTVQVDHPISNQAYYLRISADGGSVGDYEVAVDFRTQAVVLDTPASGTLSATTQQSAPLFLTCQNQLFHFVLTAGATTPASNQSVEMDIFDVNGNVVFSLNAGSGDTVSGNIFLG